MSRILTGIQSTGCPHLGNILGAILPAIKLAEKEKQPCFFFVADLHSLTTMKSPQEIQQYTADITATWYALGLDFDKHVFYRQSDITEVTELLWYLSCVTSYSWLKKAHAFKDKSNQVDKVNAGLFSYPVLMAADILLYDAEIIPVGKDQKQHIEITREICQAFNDVFKKPLLVLPDSLIQEDVMIIPGVDGEKMSKSKNNIINIFESEKVLKKQILSIQTDSTALEDPKNPDTCNVYKIYSLIASDEQISQMRKNYSSGGYGYGHAKKELLQLILEKYKTERQRFKECKENPQMIDSLLKKGAEKAKVVAKNTLQRIRKEYGFSI